MDYGAWTAIMALAGVAVFIVFWIFVIEFIVGITNYYKMKNYKKIKEKKEKKIIEKQTQSKNNTEVIEKRMCPKCGKEMRYVKKMDLYTCKDCQIYDPKEK